MLQWLTRGKSSIPINMRTQTGLICRSISLQDINHWNQLDDLECNARVLFEITFGYLKKLSTDTGTSLDLDPLLLFQN
jgi:hypothetical protein